MSEKTYYYNERNVKLCGIINNVNNNKIVIMCHGIRGNKDECGSFIMLEQALQRNGYSSFRFDFNGHGESEGKDCEMTISKEIADIESTVKFLIKKGFSEIILLGGSFGAGIVSLFPFEKYTCVKGIVLWYGALDYRYIKYGNLFTSENKAIAEKEGYYISKSLNSGKEFKFGIDLFEEVDTYKPYKELEKNNLPKLFVHGDLDSAVPYQSSKEVANRCSNSEFALIKDGEHTFQNSKMAIEQAIEVTINFIKKII